MRARFFAEFILSVAEGLRMTEPEKGSSDLRASEAMGYDASNGWSANNRGLQR